MGYRKNVNPHIPLTGRKMIDRERWSRKEDAAVQLSNNDFCVVVTKGFSGEGNWRKTNLKIGWRLLEVMRCSRPDNTK